MVGVLSRTIHRGRLPLRPITSTWGPDGGRTDKFVLEHNDSKALVIFRNVRLSKVFIVTPPF
jgi:hypothetical protein